jgi:hypothetical protein
MARARTGGVQDVLGSRLSGMSDQPASGALLREALQGATPQREAEVMNRLLARGQLGPEGMNRLSGTINSEIDASMFQSPRQPGVGFQSMRGGDTSVVRTPGGDIRVNPVSLGPFPQQAATPERTLQGSVNWEGPMTRSARQMRDAAGLGEVSPERQAALEARRARVGTRAEAKSLMRQLRMGNTTPVDAANVRLSPGSMFAQQFQQGGGTPDELLGMRESTLRSMLMGPRENALVTAAEMEGRSRQEVANAKRDAARNELRATLYAMPGMTPARVAQAMGEAQPDTSTLPPEVYDESGMAKEPADILAYGRQNGMTDEQIRAMMKQAHKNLSDEDINKLLTPPDFLERRPNLSDAERDYVRRMGWAK